MVWFVVENVGGDVLVVFGVLGVVVKVVGWLLLWWLDWVCGVCVVGFLVASGLALVNLCVCEGVA